MSATTWTSPRPWRTGTQAFAEEPLIVDDDDANEHGALET